MEKSSSVSLINLVLQADVIVQLTILLLMAASLWSWAIIFDKIMKFRLLKIRSDNFESLFEQAMLEDVFSEAKKMITIL